MKTVSFVAIAIASMWFTMVWRYFPTSSDNTSYIQSTIKTSDLYKFCLWKHIPYESCVVEVPPSPKFLSHDTISNDQFLKFCLKAKLTLQECNIPQSWDTVKPTKSTGVKK